MLNISKNFLGPGVQLKSVSSWESQDDSYKLSGNRESASFTTDLAREDTNLWQCRSRPKCLCWNLLAEIHLCREIRKEFGETVRKTKHSNCFLQSCVLASSLTKVHLRACNFKQIVSCDSTLNLLCKLLSVRMSFQMVRTSSYAFYREKFFSIQRFNEKSCFVWLRTSILWRQWWKKSISGHHRVECSRLIL